MTMSVVCIRLYECFTVCLYECLPLVSVTMFDCMSLCYFVCPYEFVCYRVSVRLCFWSLLSV